MKRVFQILICLLIAYAYNLRSASASNIFLCDSNLRSFRIYSDAYVLEESQGPSEPKVKLLTETILPNQPPLKKSESDLTPEEMEQIKSKFVPIGLKCPDKPGEGLLELIKKNQHGMISRARFYTKVKTVYRVTLEAAVPNGRFEMVKDVIAANDPSGEDLEFAIKATKNVDPIRDKVCEGPNDNKQKFKSLMESNLKYLKNAGSMDKNINQDPMQIK
ncbi:hypothetical protein [Methylobacterium thuringiense]|uniref:Uncharacterized protein n=1 Tax=Methylobacterium thuringiense TaxID=1003091 RepID=A0ABQ4TI00_9HYPH|nr:hypothetical protein [Methylobacterium thuringiense]GJE53809.1 hypothetical protein EKPJFOCH_0277 [Methylobacterium thuringiense]